jgi:hypothetical protein
MAHQRQLTDFFIHSPQLNHSVLPNSVPNSPTPTSAAIHPSVQPSVTNSTQSLPQALQKTIKELTTKYAAIFCKISNINQQITDLQQHKTNGTIPPQLSFKFKKLFTKENETNLRTTMINAAIDNNLTNLQSKITDLNTKYDQRIQDLEQTVAEPLRKCNFNIISTLIVDTFHSELHNRQLEFLLKQNKDSIKKQTKRNKFLTRQENDNQIAVLSNRQVGKLQREIKDLKLQINQTNKSKSRSKVNQTQSDKKQQVSSKNRSKNVKGRQITSTGGKKKNNGKKSNTSKNN